MGNLKLLLAEGASDITVSWGARSIGPWALKPKKLNYSSTTYGEARENSRENAG